MWLKKTEEQIKKENQKEKKENDRNRFTKAIKYGFWTFPFFTILTISKSVLIDSSFNGFGSPLETIKLKEVPDYMPEILFSGFFFSIIVFVVFLVYPSLLSFVDKGNSLMCDKCYKIKNYDLINKCECGGTFASIQKYQWIEDEQDYLVSDMEWIFDYKIYKNEG